MSSIIEMENCVGAHNYLPLPVVLVKGQGVYVWDENGKKYLDMMAAYSAISFGHCHPKILQALTDQSQQLNTVSRAFYTNKMAPFLKYACELTHQDKALPMNSGAEAVETAIKAGRKWAYTVKNVPENQAEIIVCEGNFHGRTTTIVGFYSEQQYRFGFGPFAKGFKLIPYGDAAALAAAITANTSAFLVEPMQGEAGIRIPPAGYLKKCAAICREKNVLLIADEVQTGLGRTGRLLACDYEEVKPDGLILGKALGGG
jgi:ornithine--oxo-acid transaminase